MDADALRAEVIVRRVLMVAFHFPPLAGSSGIQRTLRFVANLPDFGWEPTVLTVLPRAYERTSDDLIPQIPPNVVVHRAFGLDTRRHLSIAGRYPDWLAVPDRWMTWRWGARGSGMSAIRKSRPDAIWSTYPIATAHAIGADLHKRTGIPWVADFRDPMAQDGYPADPKVWRAFKRLEEDAIGNARFSVFTTPGAAREYQERYPRFASRVRVVTNGYDEKSFSFVNEGAVEPLNPGAFTLVHSGVVYPSERDPTCLFAALERLATSGRLKRGGFKLRFRAAGHDALLRDLTHRHGLEELVEVLPPTNYRDALAEMMRADGLLVLQASNCNAQVPAKLYEYFRAGRPLLALTDPAGDTAAAVRQAGIAAIAPLDSVERIEEALHRFVDANAQGRGELPVPSYVARLERREQARELAALLDAAAGSAGGTLAT